MTPHRAEINRANAQYSTGPKTAEGKKQSSLNALRHGLTGQIVVMPSEDLQAYQLHLKSFTDEYHPQGATEANLVQALADASWRLNREPLSKPMSSSWASPTSATPSPAPSRSPPR
jgi:hypothetical protein